MNINISKNRKKIIAQQNTKEKNFWLETLSGEPVKSSFIYDKYNYENKGEDLTGYKQEAFEWNGNLLTRIMAETGGSHYKFHVMVLTGVILMLGRYTGNRDIIVSTPIYKPDFDGMFINTVLPLRTRVETSGTFRDLLRKVGKGLVGASEHQNFPIEAMLKNAGMPVCEHGPSLLDIAVVVRNIHDPEHIRPVFPKIIFSFLVTDGSIQGEVEYHPGLYESSTIKGVGIYLRGLMEKAVSDLDALISGLDISLEEEKTRILSEFNDTSPAPAPGALDWNFKTIPQLFEKQVERGPENTAVVYEERRSTYRELNEKANRLARRLEVRGVKPGSTVGLEGETSIEMVAGILAVLKVGGICVPISPHTGEHVKSEILGENRVRTLLTPGRSGKDGEETDIFIDDETIYTGVSSNPTPAVKPRDPAYVIYTSGTTGKPKGVLVEHRNIANLVNGIDASIYAHYGENLNLCLVSSFVSGLSLAQVFGALLSGHSLYIVPGETSMDGGRLYEFYKSHKIDISDGTPSHIVLLLSAAQGAPLEFNVKHFLIGGAPLSKETIHGFLNRFDKEVPKITHVYGAAEGCFISLFHDVSRENVNRFERVPPGKPLLNQRVYIMDRRDTVLPPGMQGELCIAGPGVARGYVNRPELTKETFIDDPFFPGQRIVKTGDLAGFLPDGTVQFSGRADSRVIVNGFPISLEAIEMQLGKHRHIRDTAVTVRKNEESGDLQLCAYVASGKELSAPELREYLSGKLPDDLIPQSFIFLEKMPLNVNCKIDRDALQEIGKQDRHRHKAPRDAVEEKLARIYSEVLEVEQSDIGIDVDFARLGGQSLKAIMVSSRIHKEFEISVPLPLIFELSTIERLAEYLKGAIKERYYAIEPVEKKQYYDLSYAQGRLWILDRIEKDQVAYNVPGAAALGELDLGAFERAVRALIERHESLRTTFITVNNEPKQKIHDGERFDSTVNYLDLRGEDNKGKIVETLKEEERVTPFNLETGPLLRTKLLHLEENRFVFLYTMHHIISDAWSSHVMRKDFGALYDFYANGKGEGLSPLKIQYKDYAQWHNRQLSGENLDKHRHYWLNRFSGDIPVLELPADYPRPRLKSFKGGFVRFFLTEEVTGHLRRLGKEAGNTMFITFLAVVNVFLYRYTGQKDIIVGTPVAGREHKDLEDQIGFYINMLPLRNKLSKGRTFREVLQMINRDTLEAFEHQVYPFDRLAGELNVVRDLSRNPLFDVVVTYAAAFSRSEKKNNPGLKRDENIGDSLESGIGAAKHDLRFRFIDRGTQIMLHIQYNPGLFKEERILSIRERFTSLITGIVSNVDMDIDDLDFKTEFEKKKTKNKFRGEF